MRVSASASLRTRRSGVRIPYGVPGKRQSLRGCLFSIMSRRFEPLTSKREAFFERSGSSGAHAKGMHSGGSNPLRRARKKQSPYGGCFFLFRFKEIAKSKRQFRFGEEDRGRGYRAVAPLGRGCGVEQARSDDTACQKWSSHPR